jgi:hypothetical protein
MSEVRMTWALTKQKGESKGPGQVPEEDFKMLCLFLLAKYPHLEWVFSAGIQETLLFSYDFFLLLC